MSSNQSPHHYSLRPSERRMLAEADLFFWIGPSLETFMPRIINSLSKKDKAISLIQTQGLKLLPLRQAGHSHHDKHGHGKTDQVQSSMDPHFWLDTRNVEILLDDITNRLINADPEHQQQYQANSQQIHQQIAQLRKKLQPSLSDFNAPFLTYHDGYQYFEAEFGLHNAGFITSAELKPGARRIKELKKRIKDKNIRCIFYDAPTQPAILKSLLSKSNAKTFMLDPIGLLLPAGNKLWFKSMSSLGKQFINCQQSL